MTRARRLAAGALSLVGLVALLVGVPLALGAVVGWPLPHSWPSWAQVRTLFETSGIPDVVLIDALAMVCWIAWLDFALATLVEIGSAVAGYPAPRLRVVRPWQPLVARLITMIVLAMPVLSSRPEPGISAHHAALSVALAGRHAAPVAPAQALATDHERAPIAALRQPDPPAPVAADYVVQRGDTLWDIAARRLRNPRRWPEIWRRNADRAEPGGRQVTNPNLIVPGWRLDVPGNAPPGLGPPPVSTPGSPSSGTRPPPPPTAWAPGSAPVRSTAPTPGGAAIPPIPQPSQGPTRPAPSGPAPSPSSDGRGSSPSASVRESPGIPLPSGGIVGLALATAVAAAVAAARLHERRRWRVASAEPSAVDRLITANITRLSRAATAAVGGPPPGEDGTRVALPPHALLNALRARACGPAEIPIGLTADGRDQVIVETEALSGLALVGPGGERAARALLVAALADHRPWRSEVVLTPAIAALVDGLPSLINAQVVGDVRAALDVLEDELIRRRHVLALRGADDYRTTLDKADPMDTLLAILDGAQVAAAEADRIQMMVGLGRRLGVAVVLVGAAPGTDALEVAEDGVLATVGRTPLDSVRQLFVLSAEEAAEMLAVVSAGQGEPIERRENGQAIPEPLPEVAVEEMSVAVAATSGCERPVQLRLFGPPRVEVLGSEVRTGLRGRGRELLCLLVTRPDGLRQEELIDILWPDDDADWERSREQLTTAVTSTRRRLRALSNDRRADHILFSGDGRYRLDPSTVDADLWQFEAALQDAARATSDAERLDALERAAAAGPMEPLAGVLYPWAEAMRERIRRRAVDAVCDLAELREAAGQGTRAVAALEAARTLDPCREEVYQRLIGLQLRLGRVDAAARAYRELTRELEDLGETPSAATAALLQSTRNADTNISQRRPALSPVESRIRDSGTSPLPDADDEDEDEDDAAGALAMRRVVRRSTASSKPPVTPRHGDIPARPQPTLPILDEDNDDGSD